MLTKFIIKNFKSIVELELDMNYTEGKAPNRYKELPFHTFFNEKNSRIVPIVSIYGANASGKSNILKAVDTFIKILKRGIEDRYFPNKINNVGKSTVFKIEFFTKKKIFQYKIEYNHSHILKESLLCNGTFLFQCNNNKLDQILEAPEPYTKKSLDNIYAVECKDSNDKQINSFWAKLAKNYANLNKDISSSFNYIIENINVYIDNNISVFHGLEKLSETNAHSQDNQLDRIVDIVKKLDIDINSITYEKKTTPLNHEAVTSEIFNKECYAHEIDIECKNIHMHIVKSHHKDINGNNVIFDFKEESAGTQALAGIIGVVLLTLDKGGILFVDELERSLHPLLLTHLIELFKDKTYNINNAQLIFTTHNTDILDTGLMRLSEVAITSKTRIKGTTITKLSEFKDLRNISNFRKRYLNGEFMGIPYPYI